MAPLYSLAFALKATVMDENENFCKGIYVCDVVLLVVAAFFFLLLLPRNPKPLINVYNILTFPAFNKINWNVAHPLIGQSFCVKSTLPAGSGIFYRVSVLIQRLSFREFLSIIVRIEVNLIRSH